VIGNYTRGAVCLLLATGTSQCNRAEYRLSLFVIINWRGKPLCSHRTTVRMIAAMPTGTEFDVRVLLDETKDTEGVNATGVQLAAINLIPHTFYGNWN